MIKKLGLLFYVLFSLFCAKIMAQNRKFDSQIATKSINKALDDLNFFAANADYDNYFKLFAEGSTFIGTDATEVWDKNAFMKWAKPFFDKGRTWHFTSLKRQIFFSKDGNFAWFDELLDTQMKICRGSGVLEKINNEWKIRLYVLSMTIPNALSDDVTKLKSPIEDSLIQTLKK